MIACIEIAIGFCAFEDKLVNLSWNRLRDPQINVYDFIGILSRGLDAKQNSERRT